MVPKIQHQAGEVSVTAYLDTESGEVTSVQVVTPTDVFYLSAEHANQLRRALGEIANTEMAIQT